jgi:3-oxoacid CoA-transferase B subunit
MTGFDRKQMAARVAEDIPEGWFVNLGIGIPTMIANYVPLEREVILHSENGILGMGPAPAPDKVDPWRVNAGKQAVTLRPGGSYFHHADSFAMIRGGHIDLSILGALQVAANGDLANWMIPGKMVKGMGGAMDLVAGVKKVVVLMEHTAGGKPKLLQQCNLPLTGARVVDMVITELAVFEIARRGETRVTLLELAPEVTLDEVRAKTEAEYTIANTLVR